MTSEKNKPSSIVTIHEIARKANVSIASVSYALNNRKGISEKKRKAILKIADELGYVPNAIAKSLQSKTTNIVGLVIPNLTNSFTAELVVKLEERARAEGFYLLLGCTGNRQETELDIIQRFVGRNLDGLIIIPGNYSNEEHYSRIYSTIQKMNIPLIFVGVDYPNLKSSSIYLDLENALYTLTKYLIEKGRRNLVFFGGRPGEYYSGIRIKGIKKAFAEQGMNFSQKNHFFIGSGYVFEEGYSSIMKYLKKGNNLPDAIIGINDMVAMGVLKALDEKKVNIPGEVSVTGCDNLFLPGLKETTLTTLRLPLDEITDAIISILLFNQVSVRSIQKFVVQPELIIGNTA